MNLEASISDFLAGEPFAVAGASAKREKYGNKVLRCYLQHSKRVYPINPTATEVEGLKAYTNLESVPESIHGVSIITPPSVTENLVDDAIRLGIRNLWMQPGAESDAAVERATEAGINVIAGGPCLLVVLGFTEQF